MVELHYAVMLAIAIVSRMQAFCLVIALRFPFATVPFLLRIVLRKPLRSRRASLMLAVWLIRALISSLCGERGVFHIYVSEACAFRVR